MEDGLVSATSWSISYEEKSPSHDGLSQSYVTTEDRDMDDDAAVLNEICIQNLDKNEHQDFLNGLLEDHMIDNEELLRNIKERSNKVGINLPTVEVRFENLTVEAECLVGNRALPTLKNATWNIAEWALSLLGIRCAEKIKLNILKDVTGIIKPSRMALLLGPPSTGKTTLLLALAGKLDCGLKVTGEITYNGHTLDEFVPQKTSAYISQHDVHEGQLTVEESLNLSARFQGVGSRYELLTELPRKEVEAGIISDPEADLFVKQTASRGVQSSLITDYTLKILGLDICRDTIIGDDMQQLISGGQKRRLTTGEIIVGPTNTLFIDEISTGLDSSTTFQIVKCMQQKAHITQSTILISLLQPDPDTFNLFDDIILLLEGQIVYQGPREHIVNFFESCGFKCPERKGVADFLHEVTSRKDQEKYWADRSRPHKYITVSDFAKQFKKFHVGLGIENELSIPYDKSQSHIAALVFKRYLVSKKELLLTSFTKELLITKRNFFIHLFMLVKVVFLAIITATVFFRSTMYTLDEGDGALYIAALSLGLLTNLFNAFGELARIMQRLPVFYKQRDLLFHPPWTFTLSTFLLSIPISALESIVWVVVSYYTIGFAPEASRFFKHLLLIFLIQQTAAGIFRLVAGVCKTNLVANTGGCLALFLILFFGFVIPRDQFPNWLEWAYWVTPISYAFSSLAVNEMSSPRWMNKLASDNSTTLGVAVLTNFDVNANPNLVWICAAALFGFVVLLNILFTFTLMYLNPHEKQHTIILKGTENVETPGLDTTSLSHKAGGTNGAHKREMVLPFTPLAMSFDTISYFVDMPPNMSEQGKNGDKLQLLKEVTGTFRPGVLTALMGVSGAGKTTLLDVLSGRKTSGYIEGDVRISGFPKKQETFARICGYCEQNDIHSPHVTVHESIIYSAFLRLPKDVNQEEKMKFAEEVMYLLELEYLKNAIVGVPGISGLSTEERKRLTIAVELVANPSIIFMDEPTIGLDARAAAIVMRAVRNTVDTGRTVVCTTHHPSIDIFESFDEVILLKSGGQVIYSGALGRNSHKIIDYFEEIPGVPKIKKNSNPATWILEVTSAAAEHTLEVDFAQRYESSTLYQRNKSLVKELGTPPPGVQDLHFTTPYSASLWKQLQYCAWKQFLCYWRNPDYNLVRCLFALFCAFVTGMPFLKFGAKRERIEAVMTTIGALYNSFLFVGVNNCSSVQPMVATERRVFYREKSARFYSAVPYAVAQVLVEIPYVLLQTAYYTLILYFMMGFEWIPSKFMCFFFFHFFTFLYFTYYGMMIASITPNDQIAAIVSGVSYLIFNLFSGFGIPKPKIPKWWVWYYYMCPIAWTVYGIVTSQFSDIQDPIKMKGKAGDPTIKWYVQHHFGFDSDFLGSVAVILVGFTLFFAFIYVFCLRTLNFQRR